ncbi:hypothetical protein MYCTH_2126733 [Thermothelomyces thermophilus ATCC 42464]|uniref:Uncharacterized protein n=1 Tax=Thermothelomyces thermophilus (strain ATCC 42464 / BCRC 31852 / DSM 1799) TaxID=573729 RepID=G2QEF0_THET4|nr:uncharacterized protein MYCTH_2126733 [Thermothelomyces thermophilus ATCC 42464]AEO57733.1 hypothetical protein MYCTH_2126733 [Thermothelomyces thermophilus ATCC 42464]
MDNDALMLMLLVLEERPDMEDDDAFEGEDGTGWGENDEVQAETRDGHTTRLG